MAARAPGAGNRPDIMFIQSQNIPWIAHPTRGAGWFKRVLSRNAETGAESCTMKLAAGYRQDGNAFLTADFEFLVVHGAITINGIKYGLHDYGSHPAGYAHNTFESAEGAVLAVVTMGGPDGVTRGAPQFAFRRDRLAVKIETASIPWTFGVDRRITGPAPVSKPALLEARQPPDPSTCTKLIWQDPDLKGWTFMKADLPRRARGRQNVRGHTVDSEYFVLDGDYIISGEGRVRPGGYFCWAAEAMHGPSACEVQSLVLVKYYGPQGVIPSQDSMEVTMDPPHNPHVPAEMVAYTVPVPLQPVWS